MWKRVDGVTRVAQSTSPMCLVHPLPCRRGLDPSRLDKFLLCTAKATRTEKSWPGSCMGVVVKRSRWPPSVQLCVVSRQMRAGLAMLLHQRLDGTLPASPEAQAELILRLRAAVAWLSRNRRQAMLKLSSNMKTRAQDVEDNCGRCTK